MAIEKACWYEWRRNERDLPINERIYFGHETCEHLLPSNSQALDFVERALDLPKTKISLVTPFLSQQGLRNTQALIDCLLVRLEDLEVVCSDWGLVYHLGTHRLATPVLGRVLAAQATDPRIHRIYNHGRSATADRKIRHTDGPSCVLNPHLPPIALQNHYRSVWMDKPEAIDFLSQYNINRCELNNVAQGVELFLPGLRYTLHVSEILVAVMRRCPGKNENFNLEPDCPCGHLPSSGKRIDWNHSTLPHDLFRQDNALYYRNDDLPKNLAALPVDRIVYKRNQDVICGQ